MNIQAEISLYPLQTGDIGKPIKDFLHALENFDISVHPGNMSTTVAGEADAVFSGIAAAFKTVARDNQAVMLMKVSNACPSGADQ